MPDLTLHTGLHHPALPGLRLALRQTMTDAGQLPAWTETYADDPAAPPALLLDGRVVLRLSDQNAEFSADALIRLLGRPGPPTWQQRLSRTGQLSLRFLSALFIAFFPKCPFCWAAYASYLGATGVIAIPYQPWLIWALIGLLAINLVSLYQGRHRHGPGPFYLCLAGASLLVLNRLFVQETLLVGLGAGSLLIGSLWNSLTPKMTASLRFFARKVFQPSQGAV